jgi:hypothetical protein
MIPFDYLFVGLLVVLVVGIAIERWRTRAERYLDKRVDRHFIQITPPDDEDQKRDYTPVPDWSHKRKR